MARKATGIAAWMRNRLARVQASPVIVFGNQKSGTSAIASLLAERGGLSATIDIPPLWAYEGAAVMRGERSFSEIVRRHPAYFAADLIKEPMTTFFVGEVLAAFPRARCAFVVRDPRGQIRSLLDSRKLPGDLAEISPEQRAAIGPRITLDPEVWGGRGENYVGVLARRWNLAADNYLAHRGRLALVRYEDFVADKLGTIERLAERLGVPRRADVSRSLDVDYQPRGNRGAVWREFFGPENLARIESICAARMGELGYAPLAGDSDASG